MANSINWGKIYETTWFGNNVNSISWGSVYPVGVEPAFVISVKTDNVGTSATNQFTLPWVGTYDVDWGDGVIQTGLVDSQTHTYSSIDIYDIKVTAVSGRILFNNGGDKSKLIDIKNWGAIEWTSIGAAFYGCDELTNVTATDIPNLLTIGLSVVAMFQSCTKMISLNVSNWDTSNINNFQVMFQSCGNLTTLNVANWDTRKVTSFFGMFNLCSSLNPDVTNWDTSLATNMFRMFRVTLLDRNLSGFNINNVTNFTEFMTASQGLSNSNYDATLISWAAQSPQLGISINFGGSKYTLGGAAETARNKLINTYGWTIVDGGGI